MIAVLQRVKDAKVEINNSVCGECGRGFLILLGIAQGDSERDADVLATKISKLRVFSDNNGKMNLSLADIGGGSCYFKLYITCKL